MEFSLAEQPDTQAPQTGRLMPPARPPKTLGLIEGVRRLPATRPTSPERRGGLLRWAFRNHTIRAARWREAGTPGQNRELARRSSNHARDGGADTRHSVWHNRSSRRVSTLQAKSLRHPGLEMLAGPVTTVCCRASSSAWCPPYSPAAARLESLSDVSRAARSHRRRIRVRPRRTGLQTAL